MTRPRRYVLFGGDWNEPPTSTGRWSPAWIARLGGLAITAPPKGPRGRIDFVMSSAEISGMRRIHGGGSDHGLIAFDVRNPETGAVLWGAIFNVERGRTGAERAQLLEFLTRTCRLQKHDFLLLQEVKTYHDLLARVPGYRLIVDQEPKGATHNAILVRIGVKVTNPRSRQLSDAGWFLPGGDVEHAPTFTTLATLNGWLRAASIHEAVSVDWRNGKPVGPPRRVAARISSAVRLVAIARYHRSRRRKRP